MNVTGVTSVSSQRVRRGHRQIHGGVHAACYNRSARSFALLYTGRGQHRLSVLPRALTRQGAVRLTRDLRTARYT